MHRQECRCHTSLQGHTVFYEFAGILSRLVINVVLYPARIDRAGNALG
jgi:hypothetical protein